MNMNCKGIQASMPPYFSWIEDRVLAASALPFHHSHMHYLHSHGINILVNIGTDIPPTAEGFKHVCFAIAEECCPSFEQIIDFVNLVLSARARGEAVLIQSTRGQGVLAILIACYLSVRWACSADIAINSLIKMRPASFDNDSQRTIVKHFVTHWENHTQILKY